MGLLLAVQRPFRRALARERGGADHIAPKIRQCTEGATGLLTFFEDGLALSSVGEDPETGQGKENGQGTRQTREERKGERTKPHYEVSLFRSSVDGRAGDNMTRPTRSLPSPPTSREKERGEKES